MLSESVIRDSTSTDWATKLPDFDLESFASINEAFDRDTLRLYCYDWIPSNIRNEMTFKELEELDMVNFDWRGRLAYEKVSTTYGEQYAERVYYYDMRGNVIQLVEKRPSGLLRKSFNYDTQRRLTWIRCEYSEPNNGINDVYESVFTYDKDGRMLKESAMLNGYSSVVVYKYDNLGRLVEKEHSNDVLVGNPLCESLTYNLQGWEDERFVTLGEEELYSSKLSYYDELLGVESSFTGNISSWIWNRETSQKREYRFAYDGLNRLADAREYVSDTLKNMHTERDIRYDRNGNILFVTRTNGEGAENISFTYDGNKRTNDGFTYDDNGNLTSDGVLSVS